MKINKHIKSLLINGIILFALWSVFYTFLRHQPFIHNVYEGVTHWFTHFLLKASEVLLGLFGQQGYLVDKAIYVEGAQRAVYLDRGCLGRNLMGLFAGFLLAFPGSWKHKLWYIPMGIVIIIIINVFRISALTYVWKCCPQYGEINHDYIFKYTVYVLTFVLWFVWIKYFLPKRVQTIKSGV